MIDIREMRIGNIRAVTPAGTCPNGSGMLWNLECDCGESLTWLGSRFKEGYPPRCSNKQCPYKVAGINLVGLERGTLRLVSRLAHLPGSGRQYRYSALCKCGQVRDVSGAEFRRGNHTTCGNKECTYRSVYLKDTQAGNKTSTGKTWSHLKVGQRFGTLTLVENQRVGQKGSQRRTLWRAECGCGREIVATHSEIKRGNVTTCQSSECSYRKQYKQLHGIPRGQPKQVGIRELYKQYKSSSRRRSLEFTLTSDEFKQLTSGECSYCGAPPVRLVGGESGAWGQYKYNGIDRVNNEQGYHAFNCVSCCTECNLAKRARSLEEFEEWLDRIVEFRTGNKPSLVSAQLIPA